MFKTIKLYITDFFRLIYPNACLTCGNILLSGENYLCTKCLVDIPRTNLHLKKDNEVEEIFWGRVQIEHASAFMYFIKKSKYQKLIHKLKYHGLKEIGYELGSLYGTDLKKASWIKEIDYIIPVPLHKKRLKERGYNQSDWIGRGLSKQLEIPQSIDNLVRTKATETQTKKSRIERWKNVDSIFKVNNPEEFQNKHLLLIDDVLTTGSTLEACANSLLEVEGIKVSIATIGFASN